MTTANDFEVCPVGTAARIAGLQKALGETLAGGLEREARFGDALTRLDQQRSVLILCRTVLSDGAQRQSDWTVMARRAHALVVEVLS